MYETLLNRKNNINKDIIEFTKELVKTPSISHEENSAAKLIESKMKELEYDDVFIDEFGNAVGILYSRNPEKTLLLNCHMDTVKEEEGWTSSPYEARIEDNKLYGLGSSDCKGGIAAQIYAGAMLKKSLLPLEGNLIVAATVAEENGRSIGVRGLIEKTLKDMNLSPLYAILGEPTGLGLYYGHDGWAEFDILLEGDDSSKVGNAARAIFEDYSSNGLTKESPENWTIKEPVLANENGSSRAIIPINRRIHQSEKLGDVIGQMQHNATLLAQQAEGVAVDVMVRQENQVTYTGVTSVVRHITHAWAIDPFHPLMERSRQALAAAGCKVQPGKFKLDRLGMGTAGSTLVEELNIPTICYGPGSEDAAHTPNEYVNINNISECAYGTASIVHSLIGIPVFGWTSDDI